MTYSGPANQPLPPIVAAQAPAPRPVAIRVWSMDSAKRHRVDLIDGTNTVLADYGSYPLADAHTLADQHARKYCIPVLGICRTSEHGGFVTDIRFPAATAPPQPPERP